MTNSTPMTAAEATAKINNIACNGGFIRLSHHLRNDRAYRNVTLADVRSVLANGIVVEIEFSNDHQDWKYTVKGNDTDGYELNVVTVIFNSTFSLLAVTAFD